MPSSLSCWFLRLSLCTRRLKHGTCTSTHVLHILHSHAAMWKDGIIRLVLWSARRSDVNDTLESLEHEQDAYGSAEGVSSVLDFS